MINCNPWSVSNGLDMLTRSTSTLNYLIGFKVSSTSTLHLIPPFLFSTILLCRCSSLWTPIWSPPSDPPFMFQTKPNMAHIVPWTSNTHKPSPRLACRVRIIVTRECVEKSRIQEERFSFCFWGGADIVSQGSSFHFSWSPRIYMCVCVWILVRIVCTVESITCAHKKMRDARKKQFWGEKNIWVRLFCEFES